MKAGFTFIIYFLLLPAVFGQECIHTNLSHTHNIAVYTKWYGSETHTLSDSLDVTIEIINKKTKAKQKIHFGSSWMLDDAYSNCSNARSYTTGINKDSIVGDNDFGDIVVADFNFDGRDDIAFKRNVGGNAGPTYYFYIQDKYSRFIRNAYLTDNMEAFPDEFIPSKRQFITRIRANTYQYIETYYEYTVPPRGDGFRQRASILKDWD